MIGRLLQFGSGGGQAGNAAPSAAHARPVSSLDSVHEDIHTRNLLFPDPRALFQQNRNDQVFPLSTTPQTPPASGAANAFDSNEEVDLDTRDVRILVMQDTLGHMGASLLFDSHPVPDAPVSTDRPAADNRRASTTSRKGSLGQHSRPVSINTQNPIPTRPGAFDRRGSMHTRTPSTMETEAQRASREYRDELATFSSCIFGNSELMAHKGTSTKVHTVPATPQPSEASQYYSSIIGDGRTSIGRSSGRASKLSQSFTSQGGYTTALPPSATSSGSRKKILITRLFPVHITNDDVTSDTTPQQSHYSDDNTGFPFPSGNEDAAKKRVPHKQRRTPMYAVVLVVQLANTRSSTVATPRSLFREPGSYPTEDVFSSSYGSTKPQWWAGSVHGEGMEPSSAFDVEDRLDHITQHWDIVMRTLTQLQSVTGTTLRALLKQADVASPEPMASVPPVSSAPMRGQASSARRSGEFPRPKASKGTTKLVTLEPGCLRADVNIAAEVHLARRRLVTGLKASRVTTGQGRWGIWRDEAIWVSKWAQSLDQSPFFYNLMTGFLATHTDWLQALSPPSVRRRYLTCRHRREEEGLSLPARTVIVSEDKMAARRMIFLLSAFLPSNSQVSFPRAHRPSTSTSISGFAQSPPMFVAPMLKEESLRRKMNRQKGRRASHSRTHSQSQRSSMVPSQVSGNDRRLSDASSIRPTSLAITSNDIMSRKSSVATTTTVMPDTTAPHFSSVQRVDSIRRPRPDSSDSVATDDLKRSLKRGEGSGHHSTGSTDSRSSSRWGSVIGSLWSPRRRGSTSTSSPGAPNDPKSPTRPMPPRLGKLAQMVEEATAMEETDASEAGRAAGATTPKDQQGRPRPSFSLPHRTSEQSAHFDSPVKTTVNEKDGVIDVDFPFPDYITSMGSAISSPSSSGYLSIPGLGGGLESFEQLSQATLDGDLHLNAAGWLTRFHPDFTLQAIPPQPDLMDSVKATLRAEPTPTAVHSAEGLAERWVDVGSVVLADTSANIVRRVICRRLVKQRSPDAGHATAGMGSLTPSIVPYETQLEEEFIEEVIFKADDVLVDALEKVLLCTPDDSKDSPLARSAPSKGDASSTHTLTNVREEPAQHAAGQLNVPRVQCKTTILSALEDIIRDMIDRDSHLRDEPEVGAGGRYQLSVLQGAVRDWLVSLDGPE
ncbi:uncharacterized protein J7T54_007094 [Emericellopsis cladophorae]|uniref:Folliculin-interacting protein N-terminal domain-containing protein n=1 Tax=Emericellopsis cladophorae TaxID=2686198 RepID=A0A9Q0BHE6_9HYPO|nr:uncharacterized protein J7T54_007094 [Emericellopsis cladophorae]KAI6785452.1 hypothetical protein J7T54_007094 [Emericellopsis cladophorae]